jgi:hypothetical protein
LIRARIAGTLARPAGEPMNPEPTHGAARHVLIAALIAGTIDIAFAITLSVSHGGTVIGLLQAVASGWLGKAAFDGGVASATLGLASHYGIILVAAALYLAASRRSAWLRAHPRIAGPLYGLAIFLVMNFIVVPLSAVPFRFHYHLWSTGGDLASHLFGVGLVIALVTGRAFRR